MFGNEAKILFWHPCSIFVRVVASQLSPPGVGVLAEVRRPRFERPTTLDQESPPIKANFLFPVSKALPLFYSGLLSARAFIRESFIWPYKCLRESLGRKDVRIKKLRNLEELK